VSWPGGWGPLLEKLVGKPAMANVSILTKKAEPNALSPKKFTNSLTLKYL